MNDRHDSSGAKIRQHHVSRRRFRDSTFAPRPPNFPAVSVFTDRFCFLLAVVFYGGSALYSVLLWRRGFREDNRILYGLLASGAVLHTGSMLLRGFSLSRCPINNLFEATVFISWTIVATYLVLGLFHRLRFLGAFASPLLFAVGVFALFPLLDQRGPKPEFVHGWESLHAALILLAYGAFGLSAVCALMYLAQEHDLKFDKARAMFALMPSMQRLEKVTSSLLAAGFALLTAGLLVGGWWLHRERGYFLSDDPKIVWSALVWAAYLALLLLRGRFGSHGRRFAWGVIATFTFVLLTFWGTNLPSAIHHP
jgi:ABC-type transport system involved in cytochrome c biogenesis permease subunit